MRSTNFNWIYPSRVNLLAYPLNRYFANEMLQLINRKTVYRRKNLARDFFHKIQFIYILLIQGVAGMFATKIVFRRKYIIIFSIFIFRILKSFCSFIVNTLTWICRTQSLLIHLSKIQLCDLSVSMFPPYLPFTN